MKDSGNIYLPSKAVIESVSPLACGVNLYTLRTSGNFHYKAGQFFMVSVMGYGEVPISITSTPDEPLMLAIRKAGHVTGAIHSLEPGDAVGIRGPYGRGFPLDAFRGRDIIVVAGGLGIVPLRPLIQEFLRNGSEYGKVYLLYGAKTPADIIYKDELSEWSSSASVHLTVDYKDEGSQTPWQGSVGAVTGLLDNVKANFPDAASAVCGPEVMIRASMRVLSERGLPDERIITTLEAHMKCGVGKCGHCYMGPRFICTDGPVFSLREIKHFTD